MLIYYSVSHLG
ncbi:unnamed protein product [Acanthoscelides obtectus]|uniref:Uncharacterized protein n=1 Tax=Acanthoscelides obtectus TaxID=200917 RepID=A0A9P0LKM2_ACAOB|nr:unnamed protein product [Acanthoscelides obtectus]CAK1631732.1 hypothetical protein AOBTE_LOCUS7114 [Acanthoscelides obtectus]